MNIIEIQDEKKYLQKESATNTKTFSSRYLSRQQITTTNNTYCSNVVILFNNYAFLLN